MIFSENRYPPSDQVRGRAFSGSCSNARERRMPVSKINGVNINWRVVGDRGKDDHPWVVMTTGGRRGHDEFIPLAEKIAALRLSRHAARPPQYRRVRYLDRRRRGRRNHLDARHARAAVRAECAARFLLRLLGRRAHLDPVLSELPAGGARPVAAARHRRRFCRRAAAGTTTTASSSAPPRKAAWPRSAPWRRGRSGSPPIRATATIWQNSRRDNSSTC